MDGSPLPITAQRTRITMLWPNFRFGHQGKPGQGGRWVGEVRPQFTRFLIELKYTLFDMPEVRVLRPALVRLPDNDEGALPHVYPPADDPVLCLFDPNANEWDAGMYLAETTIPWSFDWLACYELWLMTGRWTGGGRHGSLIPSVGSLP